MKFHLEEIIICLCIWAFFFPCEIQGQQDSVSYYEEQITRQLSLAEEQNDLPVRIENLNSVLELVEKKLPEIHQLRGKCLYNIAQAHASNGNKSRAIDYFHEARDVYHASREWGFLGSTYLRLARMNFDLGNYQEMTLVLQEADSVIKDQIPAEDDYWSSFYNFFGVANYYTGNYELAIETIKKELAYDQAIADTNGAVAAMNNLANLYESKGDYDRAIEYYVFAMQQSQSLKQTNYKILSKIYSNLGVCWYRLKQTDQSQFYGKKKLALLNSSEFEASPKDFINSYVNLSLPFIESENYDSAIVYLKLAEQIHRKEELEKDMEKVYHNLGYAYLQNASYREASQYLDLALEIYEANFPANYSNKGKLFRHQGLLMMKQGRYEEALTDFQNSLRILMDSTLAEDVFSHPQILDFSSPVDIFKALSEKGNALALLGRTPADSLRYLKAALETFDINVSVIDSMRNVYQTNSKTFWNGEVKPFFEQAIEVAFRLYTIEKNPAYLEKAFIFAEKSKATLLAEGLRESAARSFAAIPGEMLEKEKDLKLDISFYQKQVFRARQKGAKADSVKIHQWQQIIFNKKQEYQQLLAELERDYPKYFEIKYQNQVISLPAIQAMIGPDEGIVEYFYGERNIFMFVIDKENISFHEVPQREKVSEMLAALTLEISEKDKIAERGNSEDMFRRFTFLSHELYNYLLKPVLTREFDQLIIIPDGPLGFLPFELLVITEAKEKSRVNYSSLDYLLKHSVIRYEYSGNFLLRDFYRSNQKSGFLGFAPLYEQAGFAENRDSESECDIRSNMNFASLKGNQQEVQSVASLLNGTEYLANSATEASFKQEAGEYSIIHLAMHGFVNHCDPLYSGLAFSPPAIPFSEPTEADGMNIENDGLLYAYEIYNLDLKADLVSLSACNTGIGKMVKGEGIMSLARAFKYAGCPNILMSLWQADDGTTALIMKEFYQNLESGMTKDKALQKAKLTALSFSKSAHPYFWATFVLIGDDLPMERSVGMGSWLLLILVSLLFTLGGYVLFKRLGR